MPRNTVGSYLRPKMCGVSQKASLTRKYGSKSIIPKCDGVHLPAWSPMGNRRDTSSTSKQQFWENCLASRSLKIEGGSLEKQQPLLPQTCAAAASHACAPFRNIKVCRNVERIINSISLYVCGVQWVTYESVYKVSKVVWSASSFLSVTWSMCGGVNNILCMYFINYISKPM